MENNTTSMEYCTILQNNIPQSSHALFTSAAHIMQHTSSLKRIRIFNAQKQGEEHNETGGKSGRYRG